MRMRLCFLLLKGIDLEGKYIPGQGVLPRPKALAFQRVGLPLLESGRRHTCLISSVIASLILSKSERTKQRLQFARPSS